MSLLRDDGRQFVIGDSAVLLRTVEDLPEGDTLVSANFTLKRRLSDSQDNALIDKDITAVDVPGTGHISNTGLSGTAELRFDIAPADTADLRAGRRYEYDIQVVTTNGLKLTLAEPEPDPRGVTFAPQVTDTP